MVDDTNRNDYLTFFNYFPSEFANVIYHLFKPSNWSSPILCWNLNCWKKCKNILFILGDATGKVEGNSAAEGGGGAEGASASGKTITQHNDYLIKFLKCLIKDDG